MGSGGGKIQSLIVAAFFLIVGFQLFIIGLVTDLFFANRRIIEDTLLRTKRNELSLNKNLDFK